MLTKTLKRVLTVVMLLSITTLVYAEDAPVYDADNFPPAFDGQNDAGPAPQAPASAQASTQGNYQFNELNASANLSLDQRMAKAERQINNLQSKELPNKIESLQNEVQTLRGQVEQLTHQLQQAQAQQHAQYIDLDKRLNQPASPNVVKNKPTVTLASTSDAPTTNTTDDTAAKTKLDIADAKLKNKLKTKTSAVIEAANNTPALKTPVEQPNIAEEQQIYQTAYDLIKAKKYNDAIAALQKMLRKYPTGQFAANAHYWLGELYGLLDKKDQSATEFGAVVDNYPESPKVSDAHLKLGLIYVGQFKWTEAKDAFKKIINHYPGTASARLAAEQLKQIKEAGH